MKLTERFDEQCVIVDSQKSTRREVIEEMVDRLCQVRHLENRNELLAAVLDREEKMSTGIGCGLAIPHAKVDFLDQMCIVACSVKRGLDFEAIDKQPVYLLFLIISPSGNTGPHIRALSAISRILSDADIRKNLIEAGTPVEFYARLQSGENKYA
ncbi:MAG TPA: PTS glucose transporter subunit IIBC [Fibrobacteres bacterium]|jgi:fructose-specific phosphotransferase system IIA component|nr:PTS glucose transporter subunit IIBC [Fibrobacterota bacterium]